MNKTYHIDTYADTGAKEMLPLNHNHVTSIAASGGRLDSYDIEYQLIPGGARYAVASSQRGVTLQNLTNPVVAVGLKINTNTSGRITIEVRTASRGT